MYQDDNRVIITLDAGGTNFVFTALQANKFIIDPIILPSYADSLDKCIGQIILGFEMVIDKLEEEPEAISFAFPGPADYPRGIIGGFLANFPAFRDGVALGPLLEDRFNLPVFINNDGDLFAYGEALAGKLPEINLNLANLGGEKVYRSLIGYTFGTGFGIGHVYNNCLHLGDNSCIETFCLRNKHNPNITTEEGVSARAITSVYSELSGSSDSLEPHEIFDIAEGITPGNQEAAKEAFARMGEIAGSAMATASTLLDGIIVIGGGITAASKYIMPALLAEMRNTIKTLNDETVHLVQSKVYNLDDKEEFAEFAMGKARPIKVYGSDKEVMYDEEKRIGVSISTIGASKAISLGAYNYALNQLDGE